MKIEPEELTLYQAQRLQPWTVPYGKHKHSVTCALGQLKHAIFHAQKTLGKIAAEVEALDHADHSWLTDASEEVVANMAADLVSAALRMGNTVGHSVAYAIVRRAAEKNGVGYDTDNKVLPGVMICK
jgi:hypothetical protein